MIKFISSLIYILFVISIQKVQAQTTYTYVEQISFRESFHQNVKINADSSLTYVKYNGDYSHYEEYVGTVVKQKDQSFKMELELRKRFATEDRRAPFQFLFSILSDSSYSTDLQLNIWYYDDEEIPLKMNFPDNSTVPVDTIINIKTNNGLLIYSNFWNPTNKDELVHKVAWNKAPKWTLYNSNKEIITLFFRLEQGEIDFFSKN